MLNLNRALWMVFLAALAFPMPAKAAGLWEPATITRISLRVDGVTFIRVDLRTSNAGHVKAACSINGYWDVAFDASTAAGQAMLSLALSAKLSKHPVRVTGSGTCPAYPSIEGISFLEILPVD